MFDDQRERLRSMIADCMSIDAFLEEAQRHNRRLTDQELDFIKLICLRLVIGTSFLE